MSLSMFRWSGWSLLIGSILLLVSTTLLGFVIPGPAGPNGPPSVLNSVISLVGGILVLVGLPAAYMRQAKQVGWLGLVGFIALLLTALLLGIVLSIVAIIFVTSVPAARLAGSPPPLLFVSFTVGGILQLIGGLLFGIAIIRARVFPALIGWLLIVGVIVSIPQLFPLPDIVGTIASIVSSVLFFVGLGWLGYVLALQTTEAVAQSPATATETAE